jgi:hypothetical protein
MAETFVPDNLIAGHFPIASKVGVVLAGEGSLVRGTVLGLASSGDGAGKYRKVDSTHTDGTQTAAAVLSESVDAVADVSSVLYLTGEFNERALVFGGTDTVATHKVAAEARNLYFRPTQK